MTDLRSMAQPPKFLRRGGYLNNYRRMPICALRQHVSTEAQNGQEEFNINQCPKGDNVTKFMTQQSRCVDAVVK